jgi:hypothetical protein
MKTVALVPRLADHGERDRLWRWCRRYWGEESPELEIVEGHDETSGPFNRSAALNKAAEGEWDVAVILDADTILDADSIRRGVKVAAETGHLVLPFTDRCLVSRQGTRRILQGYRGAWRRFVTARQTPSDSYVYISGCQIVPRALWDEIGGFDERFESYGGEDDAFHAASVALTGHDARSDRLEGSAWHLWHRPSPEAANRPARKLVMALAERYTNCADDEERMRALLAEPRTPDQVAVSVLSCPGRDTLEQTIASLDEHLDGPVGRKIICVDAEDVPFEPFPGWEAIPMGESRGYANATRRCQQVEIESGQPWILHVEDDVLLNGPFDLREMQRVMEENPDLAQLSLKRQPWHEEEVEAGDMLGWRSPESFDVRRGVVAHRSFWAATISLTRRRFLAEHQWPLEGDSERRFGNRLFRQNPRLYAGILGGLEDRPRITHIGRERAGHGY